MFTAKPEALLDVTDDNHVGTSVEDSMVYTCSGGAKFFYYGGIPGGELAIYLDATSAQVITTPIQNLSQIVVTYLPANDLYPPIVEVLSATGEEWNVLSPVKISTTSKAYNVPFVGDYYVRIKRNGSNNAYIKIVEYCRIDLSGCPNCFIYKP